MSSQFELMESLQNGSTLVLVEKVSKKLHSPSVIMAADERSGEKDRGDDEPGDEEDDDEDE